MNLLLTPVVREMSGLIATMAYIQEPQVEAHDTTVIELIATVSFGQSFLLKLTCGNSFLVHMAQLFIPKLQVPINIDNNKFDWKALSFQATKIEFFVPFDNKCRTFRQFPRSSLKGGLISMYIYLINKE